MNQREQGKKRLKDILGDRADDIISKFEAISPDFAKYVVDYGYGDIYSREGLTDRERELAAVSCMIGQGNTGLPLRAHLQGMLNVGWTKEEIIEVLIFLSAYKGFPSSVDAILHLQDLLDSEA